MPTNFVHSTHTPANRDKTTLPFTTARLQMKDFCTQSPVGFVTSVQNAADKTAPAVRLRQAAPSCRPTLGHPNCQVDIWDMLLSLTDRICRFEQMEPRQLLAADAISPASQPALSIESPAIEPAVVQVTSGSVGGRVGKRYEHRSLRNEGWPKIVVDLSTQIRILRKAPSREQKPIMS